MIMPHHTDQPQPTKQNSRQNACDIPIIQLITKEPIRGRAPSCCEKRGTPKHRQKNPDIIVPLGENMKKQKIN